MDVVWRFGASQSALPRSPSPGVEDLKKDSASANGPGWSRTDL